MKLASVLLRVILACLAVLIVTIFLSDYYIESFGENTFDKNKIDELPKHRYALVLGTSKYQGPNSLNKYYTYRINAVEELYEKGKFHRLIISGDNQSEDYNEPGYFIKDLREMGMPDSAITIDPSGLRTFDSVIRAKEVFGLDSVLIISQEFQNLRALFIARSADLHAIAYNAETVPVKLDFRTYIREKFARVKAILDVYVLKTKPKFGKSPAE